MTVQRESTGEAWARHRRERQRRRGSSRPKHRLRTEDLYDCLHPTEVQSAVEIEALALRCGLLAVSWDGCGGDDQAPEASPALLRHLYRLVDLGLVEMTGGRLLSSRRFRKLAAGRWRGRTVPGAWPDAGRRRWSLDFMQPVLRFLQDPQPAPSSQASAPQRTAYEWCEREERWLHPTVHRRRPCRGTCTAPVASPRKEAAA